MIRYEYDRIAAQIANGQVIIRPECFGCITFDMKNGKTEYIAPENAFERQWILQQCNVADLPPLDCLSAPEIVYWTSTHRCNYACQGCYVLRESAPSNELSTERVKHLIEELARNKVFQLAIGGGEPFLRSDLFEIAQFSRTHGVLPTVVTNGSLIMNAIAKQCNVFGQINVSIDGTRDYYLRARGVDGFASADRAVRLLLIAGNRVGINFVASERNVDNLTAFLAYTQSLQSLGNLCEINMILFKPFGRGEPLDKLVLTPSHVQQIVAQVSRLQRALPHFPVRFLEYCTNVTPPYKPSVTLLPSRSCMAGHLSLCVGVDGELSPCSYTQHIPHHIGNVTQHPLQTLWHSPYLQKFRRGHLHSPCETCQGQSHCRGVCQFIPEQMIQCKFYF